MQVNKSVRTWRRALGGLAGRKAEASSRVISIKDVTAAALGPGDGVAATGGGGWHGLVKLGNQQRGPSPDLTYVTQVAAHCVLPVPLLVTGAGAGGKLVLRNYGLAAARCTALAAALEAMPAVDLKLLDLSSNQLSDTVGRQLLDAVADKTELALLDLRANLLGRKSAKLLAVR